MTHRPGVRATTSYQTAGRRVHRPPGAGRWRGSGIPRRSGLPGRPGRLRAPGRRLRHERRGRAPGADGRGRVRGPVRGRLGRPAERDALALARRSTTRRSARSTFDAGVRGATRSRSRGLRDGGVDLLLIETIFDTLNAKAAIAAATRRRARAPAVDLGHDRRPERPHAVRADRRGVLDVGRARRAADRRRQLLARRDARCGRTSRSSRASRRRTGRVLPERRPARTRSAATTRPPEDDERAARASSRGTASSTSSAAAAARRPSTSARSPTRSRDLAPREVPARRRAVHALQRARAVRDRARDRLRDDRRAHERHRLGAVPPADRGRRLSRPRSTSRSSRCAAAPTCSTSTWTPTCSTASRR